MPITNGNEALRTFQKVSASAELLTQVTSDTSAKKKWSQMDGGEKLLHVITLGFYSPKFNTEQIQEARSLMDPLKQITETSWQAVYNDGSAIYLSKKDDESVSATTWNLTQNKPFSNQNAIFSGEDARTILASLQSKEPSVKLDKAWVSEQGHTCYMPSCDTLPCYLSLSVAAGRCKGNNRIMFDQITHNAMRLQQRLGASIQDEFMLVAEKALVLPTTPYTSPNIQRSHPVESFWCDIPRNLIAGEGIIDQVVIEGVQLKPDARRVLNDAICDNQDHMPTEKQREEIMCIQGDISDGFRAALCSSTAITTLSAALAQSLMLDARALMPGMNTIQDDLAHCMELGGKRTKGRRVEVSTQDIAAGSYKGTTTYTEPAIKFNADIRDNPKDFGVAVTRAEIVIDSDVILPEKDGLDYIDCPVTYSGDVYWFNHNS
ncbi:hypothetical protein A6J66_000980 [Yersinia enterocolitica]|nr:hypothetical protein A6J66_000980 [Yersinia enterocolitica]